MQKQTMGHFSFMTGSKQLVKTFYDFQFLKEEYLQAKYILNQPTNQQINNTPTINCFLNWKNDFVLEIHNYCITKWYNDARKMQVKIEWVATDKIIVLFENAV